MKVFLKISQNSQEIIRARVFFLIKLNAKACNFIKKETLVQVFFCKFCGSFENTFFTEHLWATASIFQRGKSLIVYNSLIYCKNC